MPYSLSQVLSVRIVPLLQYLSFTPVQLCRTSAYDNVVRQTRPGDSTVLCEFDLQSGTIPGTRYYGTVWLLQQQQYVVREIVGAIRKGAA